jgi:hypothetical protein
MIHWFSFCSWLRIFCLSYKVVYFFKFRFSGDVPVPAVRELNQLLHASQHLSHARQDQEFLRQAQNIPRRGQQNLLYIIDNCLHLKGTVS